ncbi:MAG: SurA N-terminal domain-containing protein [Bdellovibrionota bacterium]
MQDFQFQLQNRLQYFQSQGINITKEQQGFVQDMIIGGFINERILYTNAKQVGFVTSTDQVRNNIRDAFSDSEGNFNFDFYNNYVRNRLGKTQLFLKKKKANASWPKLINHGYLHLVCKHHWHLKQTTSTITISAPFLLLKSP